MTELVTIAGKYCCSVDNPGLGQRLGEVVASQDTFTSDRVIHAVAESESHDNPG